jgi:hypothetical protein
MFHFGQFSGFGDASGTSSRSHWSRRELLSKAMHEMDQIAQHGLTVNLQTPAIWKTCWPTLLQVFPPRHFWLN